MGIQSKIDEIISGAIQFVYSLIFTFIYIIYRPVKHSNILSRVNINNNAKLVKGSTLLFVSIFIFCSGPWLDFDDINVSVDSILSSIHKEIFFQYNSDWQFNLALTVIIYLIFDISAILIVLFFNRKKHPSRRLERIRYILASSFALATILMRIMPALAILISYIGTIFNIKSDLDSIFIIILATYLYFCIPAIPIVAKIDYVFHQNLSWWPSLKSIPRIILLLIVGLAIPAIASILLFNIDKYFSSISGRPSRDKSITIEASNLRCFLAPNNEIRATAQIRNTNVKSVIMSDKSISITLNFIENEMQYDKFEIKTTASFSNENDIDGLIQLRGGDKILVKLKGYINDNKIYSDKYSKRHCYLGQGIENLQDFSISHDISKGDPPLIMILR